MPIPKDYFRNPYETEIDYFKSNPTVGGMATEDNKVILNPFSKLNDTEKKSVALNEYGRILMRTNPNLKPNFKLTKDQENFLNSNSYKDANEEDRLGTIAARLLSNDPSAGTPTIEQLKFINLLENHINK
jgi:hypothetical protein